MNSLTKKTRTLSRVYFTNMPNSLFQQSERSGNFAINGVAFGLVRCQKIFWITNAIVIYVCFNRAKILIIKCLLFCICSYIHKQNLDATLKFTNMLEDAKII